MKMLFITEKFPPSEGGSRVYYYNLCKNYPSQDVFVLTKKIDGYEEFDRKQHFKIIRRGRPLQNWKYYQIPKILSPLLLTIYMIVKNKIDVIHCGDFFPAGAIGLAMKKVFGKPYVYYVHGEGNTWFKQYRFQPKFRKVILNNADRIVAACSFADEGVKRDLGEGLEKVVKITPGVVFQKFEPNLIDNGLIHEFGLENKKIILTIGRLVERKGQDTVIKAMPKIIAEIPNAVYLMGGRGPYEYNLRKLAADIGVEDKIRFLGYVPDERISSLYSICNVFVMVNRETVQDGPEGFGMVFTEASASGKPVIGGRSGGTEDSIVDGFTGYRVDPDNLEEIADSIIRILKNEKLAGTLGRNGREWVVKNFDWRDKARQLEQVNMSIFSKARTLDPLNP
jgi:phosphatidylinositol alpha-1,6-mannosyltransferase